MIAAARERGIPVIGELELAWRLLANEFIAVTGTNGKTTTVQMLDAILTAMARHGLNGQRLAQRSKVSDSEISRILSGQSTPGLEKSQTPSGKMASICVHCASVSPIRP